MAGLTLSGEEVAKFQKELGKTLEYVEILEELDTEGTEPTSQVTGLENVFREDKLEEERTFSRKEALSGTENPPPYFKTKSLF